ncbi:MAG TPA: TRAP transporter TatT component family protein [Pyrinomonadaceae bacterium]|nr:TRAP transporter TatT component family protein [Pyrinomonadaceae bacterium]
MPKTSEEIRAIADGLYMEREETESVRRSLEILREAPDDYEALWRLGRAHFFLGQEAGTRDEARSHYTAGVRAGRSAVRVSQDRVEGHFWLGVNLALLAQLRKPLGAIRAALEARRELKRAVSIDAGFHGAGPLRVLARLESKLPLILGGGRARARSHFEEALRLAPSNTVTRIYFAELLLECGEHERARAELEALLAIPFDAAWAFEIRRDRERAGQMLEKAI